MGYFGRSLYHSAQKRDGSMNSTSKEKGTDGKNNNTSEYNHQYYMKNKEKWGVKQTWSKDDKDFDDKNYDDKDAIGDTDFYLKKRDDGSFYVLLEDSKWNIPKGADIEALKGALQKAANIEDVKQRSSEYDKIFKKYNTGEQEFDVDAAARDVIRGKYKNGAERKAALGDDYELVQKRVNEMMKKNVKHSDDDYLEHHGILGQKWGIRRFQNKDGTLTPAGRKHQADEGYDRESRSKSGGFDKKKFAKGAAVAAGVAVGAALIANPTTRATLAKYGKTAVKSLGKGAETLADKTVKGGKAIAKKTGERLDKVADAMVDAALLSAGGVAIDKVTKELDPGENATESQKDRAKILTDTVTAGIKTATGASNGSNNNNGGGKKGGTLGADQTAAMNSKVGAPSKKGVNKQSQEWNNLMNGKDDETKKTIRSMASAGYDIDQIDKYINHSDITGWIHASEFGSFIVE